MNKRRITVQLRNVYGAMLAYPADEDAARFAALAGTKTLRRSDLCLIQDLGFDVVQIPERINLEESA